MADQDFGLRKIGQISVTVEDVERSVVFYRDVLGMELLFQVPPGLAFFDCGGVRLMVGPSQGEEKFGTSVIYYQVDDIRAAAAALEGRGVVFEREPQLAAKMPDHELWLGFFRDPDHNLLAIMSEVRR